ncbi:hypothetical protein RW26_16685 [Aeromonas sp. L_1B5_3]|nr:hypothetical protein RW26_16685 [Aeromonas sp. L_1B5_3]
MVGLEANWKVQKMQLRSYFCQYGKVSQTLCDVQRRCVQTFSFYFVGWQIISINLGLNSQVKSADCDSIFRI